MGCCASVERDDSAKLRNDEIDEQLRLEKLNEKKRSEIITPW
jgi:guanine nucleotide-binding protein subunit alpha